LLLFNYHISVFCEASIYTAMALYMPILLDEGGLLYY
jgi:hypothetical protein